MAGMVSILPDTWGKQDAPNERRACQGSSAPRVWNGRLRMSPGLSLPDREDMGVCVPCCNCRKQ